MWKPDCRALGFPQLQGLHKQVQGKGWRLLQDTLGSITLGAGRGWQLRPAGLDSLVSVVKAVARAKGVAGPQALMREHKEDRGRALSKGWQERAWAAWDLSCSPDRSTQPWGHDVGPRNPGSQEAL